MTSFFFFFKQKTAYEMRISDWSSDVCSSDLEKGDWYDAQKIENTVDAMAEAAGLQGYAFADVRPEFIRDKDDLTMTITFKVADAPRVYVERVALNGNTRTKDKVLRPEFRLAARDAFNSSQQRPVGTEWCRTERFR